MDADCLHIHRRLFLKDQAVNAGGGAKDASMRRRKNARNQEKQHGAKQTGHENRALPGFLEDDDAAAGFLGGIIVDRCHDGLHCCWPKREAAEIGFRRSLPLL
jgi:hypothetical protein